MELLERIKRDFRFSLDEVRALAISSLILGFIAAFRDFSLANFIVWTIIATASILFHLSVQKIVGLHIGYKIDFKIFWYGLFASLIICFISNGKVWWLIAPGGITASLLAKYRIGKFRFGLNYYQMGIIGVTGPVASIIFGSIFKNIQLYTAFKPEIFHTIFVWNLVYAVISMLPIPPLDGHLTFFAGRLTYAFVAGSIIIYCLLILLLGIYSLIWALIGGAIVYTVYYLMFERAV